VQGSGFGLESQGAEELTHLRLTGAEIHLVALEKDGSLTYTFD